MGPSWKRSVTGFPLASMVAWSVACLVETFVASSVRRRVGAALPAVTVR